MQTDSRQPELGECALTVAGAFELVESFHPLVTGKSEGRLNSMSAMEISVVDERDVNEGLPTLNPKSVQEPGILYLTLSPRGLATVTSSGVEASPWTTDIKELTRIRRRYMLTGATLESSRVYDIARVVGDLHRLLPDKTISLSSRGRSAVNTLYASLFTDGIESIKLQGMPGSHDSTDAPDYLNILRIMDIPQVLELARTRAHIQIQE